MSLTFTRINIAISWTIEYYYAYRIKDEIEFLSSKGYGGANSKTVQDRYNLVFDLHKDMEDEITQTIQNSYPATQILLFDFLKSWLGDYRIKQTNAAQIKYVIEEYNNDLYNKFVEEVNKKEISFKSTHYYSLDHGAEYQVEQFKFPGLLPMFPLTGEKEIVTKKNSKFFCLYDTPEYIDLEYFDDYILRLDHLVSNFRNILKKYVGLYQEGKLPAANHIIISPANKIESKGKESSIKELPEPLAPISKKLKSNLTVEQIGFLFKMLHEAKLIEVQKFKEIHEFISKNFTAVSKNETEDISSGKLARIWSDFDISTASFWDVKFVDLHNLAKKRNPNNIKKKR